MTASGLLIGTRARVASATAGQLAGMSGTVVDETRNMIVLETASGRKSIAKACCTWELGGRDVDGAGLVGRPAERAGA